MTSAALVERLNGAGIPCGPIYSIDQAFADPQVQHLGIAQKVPSGALGEITLLGQPFTLSRTPNKLVSGAPEYGEHTDAVLAEFGFTPDDIAGFRRNGTVLPGAGRDWPVSSFAVEQALDLVQEPRQLDRLGIEIIATRGHGLFTVLHQGMGGERDDRDRAGRGIGLDPARRLPAVYDRQTHVHQDQIRFLAHRHSDALAAVDRNQDLEAVAAQAP
jgi:hypothetical protein